MLHTEEFSREVDGLAHDRRREPRSIAHGSIAVIVEEPPAAGEFQAVLVDSSPGGLCIRHWSKELSRGQKVLIRSEHLGEARAHVIWNWAIGPVVMTGLQLGDEGNQTHSEISPHIPKMLLGRTRLSLALLAITTLLLFVAWLLAR
jgi:hypothetical protein